MYTKQHITSSHTNLTHIVAQPISYDVKYLNKPIYMNIGVAIAALITTLAIIIGVVVCGSYFNKMNTIGKFEFWKFDYEFVPASVWILLLFAIAFSCSAAIYSGMWKNITYSYTQVTKASKAFAWISHGFLIAAITCSAILLLLFIYDQVEKIQRAGELNKSTRSKSNTDVFIIATIVLLVGMIIGNGGHVYNATPLRKQ